MNDRELRAGNARVPVLTIPFVAVADVRVLQPHSTQRVDRGQANLYVLA